MVRTAAAGIRVSAGKSSKKVGGGSAPSTSSSVKSGGNSSSIKLPPIPHQETPSWQKPITNFFKSNSPLKPKENKTEEDDKNNVCEQVEDEAGPSKKKLKFGNEETTETEPMKSGKPKENGDINSSEPVLESNKENKSKNKEFDEGASSSKD